VCDTYIENVLEFNTEAGYTYQIYKDDSGGTVFNPANWELVIQGVFSNGLQSIYQGLIYASEAYLTQYFIVKIGKPVTEVSNDGPSGFVSPYTGANPVASFHSNYSLAWTEENPVGDTISPDSSWSKIRAKLEQLLGRSLTEKEAEIVKYQGCVGVLRVLMRKTTIILSSPRPEYPSVRWKYPERDQRWHVTGYAHYSDAVAHVCPSGHTRKVIAIIHGQWNGSPPSASSTTVPVDKIDGSNWIVRMPSPNDDKWFNISHGLGLATQKHIPQVGHVFDGDPPSDDDFPDFPQIYVVVCMEEE